MTKEILHTFLVSEASLYGVESAVILNNIRFWLLKNKANNRHNIDGFYWTYNSAAAFCELFPYINQRTISRYLKRLCILGVLKSGNFNNAKYDRTMWYTIPAEFAVIDIKANNDAIGQNDKWIGQNDKWIGQNGEWIGQNGEPIPDSKPDSKPEITITAEVKKRIFDWAKNHSYWRTATTSEEKFIEVLENEKGGLKKQFEQYEESLRRGLDAAGLGRSSLKNTSSNNYATHQHISATDRIRQARNRRTDEQSRIIDI